MEGEELENVVEAIHMARTKKLRSHHIYSSSDSFTHVDVYPFYDIGKAVKKFKDCKRHGSKQLPAWVPEVKGILDTPNPAYRQVFAPLAWKALASSASGASTCHGRHRNASEQQQQDLDTVQQ